ncbi:DUF1080 domain-containing protein [Haloferula sp. BvORR071]|uniref:3-keto-disaccharide hydrolase n=1 Tax=Haloferula sp. BvORR071 TaxID=1396141 RepID=UPI00054D3C51|nr:DUF1080 domain-containing protein [Haloferula sp. BvORR071]
MKQFLLLALLPFAPASAAEEGFKDLFNGKDLSGWVPKNVAADTFSVKDGMIVTTGLPIGFLSTERMYENFIMELDWRHMKEAGNSGVFIWGEGLPAPGVPYARGIEVQILDLGYAKNKGANEWFTTHGDIFAIWGAKMTPTGKVSANGARSFPMKETTLPSPQWNHYRIECNNGEIKLSVNGELTTTGKDCNPKKGFLCLESEGSEAHFKNIRIKELPSTGASEAQTARGYEGFKQLFNGKDMGGWSTDKPQAWSSDGVGYTAAAGEEFRGSKLVSDGEYGDCVLCVDWRSPDKKAGGKAAVSVRGLSIPIGGEAGSGAAQPSEKADLKPGEWNRFFITVQGKSATVELNEKIVAKDIPLTDLPAKGKIAFEHAGDGVEFTNVFLKPLN